MCPHLYSCSNGLPKGPIPIKFNIPTYNLSSFVTWGNNVQNLHNLHCPCNHISSTMYVGTYCFYINFYETIFYVHLNWSCTIHICRWPQTKFWYSVAVLTAPRYVIFETHSPRLPLWTSYGITDS